jgi:Uma2 family endonuclease
MNEKPLNGSAKYKTPEDYLMSERHSATKNEYVNGKMIPRSGSNRWHNLIVSNVAIAVGSRIHGPKNDIYIGNMRVKLKSNYICYPDIVIVAGEPAFGDQSLDLLLNPTIVVEIISTGTSSSDKTQRLENFLAMDSIKECVFVKEDEMRLEHYAKQNAKQWIYRIYNERDDVVSMDSINCKVSLSEIYAQIKFGQAQLSSTAVN